MVGVGAFGTNSMSQYRKFGTQAYVESVPRVPNFLNGVLTFLKWVPNFL